MIRHLFLVLLLASIFPLLSGLLPAAESKAPGADHGPQTKAARPKLPAADSAALAPLDSAEAETNSPTLPIRRVILYRNGVAVFERRGPVSGNANVKVPLLKFQVPDAWRSMLVADYGGGQIGALRLDEPLPPGSMAAGSLGVEAFTDDEPKDAGLVKMLPQLQGTRVQVVTTAGAEITGMIINLEQREVEVTIESASGNSSKTEKRLVHTLLLGAENGTLVPLNLPEIRSVRILDDNARNDLVGLGEMARSQLRGNQDTMPRAITVNSRGTGTRDLSVCYAVAAPGWGTSYRLVMDHQGKPFLQGWAEVENATEEDWNDVMISLLSGTPNITVSNPPARLVGLSSVNAPSATYSRSRSTGYQLDGVDNNDTSIGTNAGYIPAGRSSTTPYHTHAAQPQADEEVPLDLAVTEGKAGVTADTRAGELADLYNYEIRQPLTIQHHQRALIPIFQSAVEGERISMASKHTDGHPRSGLRLHNNSSVALEAGPITVYEENAVAGTAVLPPFKPGAKPFLLYGEDPHTWVVSTSKAGARTPSHAKADSNRLYITYKRVDTWAYSVENKGAAHRVVYIAHQVDSPVKVTGSRTPVNRNGQFCLFRLELDGQSKETLQITEEADYYQSDEIGKLTAVDLERKAKLGELIPSDLHLLQRLLAEKQQLSVIGKEKEALSQEIAKNLQEQNRLQANLKTVGNQAQAQDLTTLYATKLRDLELQLDNLHHRQEDCQKRETAQQAAIQAAQQDIAWDHPLGDPAR